MLSNLKVMSLFARQAVRLPLRVPVESFRVCSVLKSSQKSSFEHRGLENGQMEVHHDSKKNIFSIKLAEDVQPAVLMYCWVGDRVIDFHHTEVPMSYQGKGIAKILAKAGLEYAVRENLKVVLSCSYMAKYFVENPQPEYLNLRYSKT